MFICSTNIRYYVKKIGGEVMENLKKRASKVSFYLQRLMESKIFPEVQVAVAKKDKESFLEICKKAKIPSRYIVLLISILLATGVAPLQFQWR